MSDTVLLDVGKFTYDLKDYEDGLDIGGNYLDNEEMLCFYSLKILAKLNKKFDLEREFKNNIDLKECEKGLKILQKEFNNKPFSLKLIKNDNLQVIVYVDDENEEFSRINDNKEVGKLLFVIFYYLITTVFKCDLTKY